MPPAAKTLDQQIAETKAKLDRLQAKKDSRVLEKTSVGVDQLLTVLDDVCNKNGCKVVDVFRAVSRIKKLGLTIDRAPRKTTEPKKIFTKS
jgi:uncharacterized membrane protein